MSTTSSPPICSDCKGQCSVRGYRCDHCSSHGANSGVEPCADCRDDSDVMDRDEAVCFACAMARGVDLTLPEFAVFA